MSRFFLFCFILIFAGNVFAQTVQQNLPSQMAQQKSSAQNPFESGEKFFIKNKIDELLVLSLAQKNLEPAPLCSDAVFIRRVFLDGLGTLPTPNEARDFLADKTPEKREKLIDAILQRHEFADYFGMKWGDVLRVKAEFPVNLWPNGAANYDRWLREALRTEMAYDQFVRELLLADGSNFRDGAANFYRAVSEKDADTIAEAIAQTFLGTRIGFWSEEKRKELAVFFSRVGYKETTQWKEEIVFWTRKELDSPNVIFPDGTKGIVSENEDPRSVFAAWLVCAQNKNFNRCIANRIWFWLFGYGLVHEPDDFREDNPPVHEELLDYLAQEVVHNQYNLKNIYRIIFNSSAYQQSAISRGTKFSFSHDESETYDEAETRSETETKMFAAYPIRRLEAEVLQDALVQIFGISVVYQSEVPEPFTLIPSRFRTISLADASVTSSFLEMFGRASRDTGLESDRNNDVTEAQRLFFLNSTEVNTWIQRFVVKSRFLARLRDERRKVLDEIWLTFLSRYPTPEEVQIVAASFQNSQEPPQKKVQDLIWALLNSSEFLCKH